jgi:hypothetical protein
MVTYKQLKSILLQDGKKYSVDMLEWVEKTLTGSELAEYQTDAAEMDPFYKNLQDDGILTVTPIVETINTGHGTITIVVGTTSAWIDQRIVHPKYAAWQARFAADPDVAYNPEIIQE